MTSERQTKIATQFIEAIPHARALGMTLTEIGGGHATITMPYDAKLVGDPETGVIHGGAVSALLDTCGGAAVMVHDSLPIGTATFEFKGLNALIARLIEAGLITDQDATSARMGMAMMAAPAPSGDEEQLISESEMTAEGHVYVNGNRMK